MIDQRKGRWVVHRNEPHLPNSEICTEQSAFELPLLNTKHYSYASHWGKSGRLSYKDFLRYAPPPPFYSIRRMTVQWLGSGESNLKSGLHESAPAERCGEGICHSRSVGLRHRCSFCDGLLSPQQLQLLPCTVPICMETVQPGTPASSDRTHHVLMSFHCPYWSLLFPCIEELPMHSVNNYFTVVLYVNQYPTEVVYSPFHCWPDFC